MNDEFKKALAKAKAGTPIKKRKSVRKANPGKVFSKNAKVLQENMEKRQEITKRLLQLRTLIAKRSYLTIPPSTFQRDTNTFDKIVTAFTLRKISDGLTTKEREKLNSIYRRYKL